MSEKHICKKRVSDHAGFYFYPCGNKAKYNENGGWYCGTHAPSRIKARAEKRGPTQWERECAEQKRVRARSDMLVKVYKALRIVTKELVHSGYYDNQDLINRSNVTLINAKALLTDEEKAS